MIGGQAALEIGVFAAVVAIVIGTLYGAISGLVGGFVDGVLMRFVDILLSIPFLFIVLVLATKYNGTVLEISLVLGVFSWLVPARLVRGEVLTLRTRDFVLAAADDGLEPYAADLPTPDPERDVGDDRQRHVPDRRLDPGAGVARLPRLRPSATRPRRGATCSATPSSTSRTATGGWSTRSAAASSSSCSACNLIGDALRDAVDVRLRRR